ncbi:MAG: creatininase family protein [Chloroflexota bacterium]|nr:creatininase family protein [Chloroflexota bacterium]
MSGRQLLFNEITRGESAARAPGALAVVPVAATEQHGPHLPLGTDTFLVETVARQAAAQAALEIDVLVTPTLAIGASHHHFPFGGTLSLASETYYRAVRDLVLSLIRDGFQRVFVINGHGGNHELIQVVVRDLVLEYQANLAAASYWDLARAALAAQAPETTGRLPGHAGYFETAMLMAIRPDLVRTPLPQRTAEEISRAAVPSTPYRLERSGHWASIGGHTDSPRDATPEGGQRLLEIVVPAVAGAFLEFARLPLLFEENPTSP